jgi:hypothetical protein
MAKTSNDAESCWTAPSPEKSLVELRKIRATEAMSAARCQLVKTLFAFEQDSNEMKGEILQLLLDILDVVEQTDTEKLVLAAIDAYQGATPLVRRQLDALCSKLGITREDAERLVQT